MRRLFRAAACLAAAVMLLAVPACGPAPGKAVEDLTQRLDAAVERRPAAESFSIVDATIGGVTKRAIRATQSSRVVFSVTVPRDASLETWIGVPEDVWPLASTGMLFRVLIQEPSAEGPYQAYAKHLNPHLNRTDRAWHQVTVDLSRFAGATIRLFLNTNFTPPAESDATGRTAGMGLWGEPRIVAR